MVELVSDVSVELITAHASDDMVAKAAWVSFDADKEARLNDRAGIEKLIDFLYRNKHMSPFEHGIFTFKVDVPLFVAREFHRHRTASYNEVSGRYTEMKPRFYCGDVARVQKGKPGDYYFEEGSDEQTALYRQSKRKKLKRDWEVYQERLASGMAKEQAREDLPLSLMTQFYVTMNPRNLMQFLTLRNDKHALKEIRDTAVKMEEIFAESMPLTYKAYKKVRDAEKVDTKALELEIKALREEVARLEASKAHLKKVGDTKYEYMIAAYKERDEALRVRDEAVEKYNKLFTSTKEAEKEAKQNKDWQYATDDVKVDYETEFANGGAVSSPVDINTIINKGCEYIIPRAARVVESAAPVYNVYVENKGELPKPEEIAKRVIEAIDRLERRKGRR